MRGELKRLCWWGVMSLGAVALVQTAIAAEAGEARAAIQGFELAPPSAREGATMFTRLDPAQAGVSAPNSYDDPKMWTEHFERFAYGSMGTGVAVGDYDNDGRPDIYVVVKTGENRLFRNLGGWKFEDVTETAGVGGPAGPWKAGVSFADVNNDGWLDLYVCRVAAPNLLFVNRGDGTFIERAAEAGVAVTTASVMGAFCDYDRDGWLDLYLVTNLLDFENRSQGERDRLFRNRGDGTFEDVTERAGIFGEGQKHAAVWWDYDADGWQDVYVTYDYGWPDQLYRNNGDGTFTNVLGTVLPYVPRFSMGADVGDVNNDGRPDLFVLDMLPTTRERDQRAMIDARAHIAELPDPAMTPQYMRNMLFLNTGMGRFQEAGFLAGVAASDWSWASRLEDFDNDGRLDLFVTNGTIREFFDGDLRKRIENLPPNERKRVFRNSPVLRERNFAFRNHGDLQFENTSAAWGLDELGVSFGAATGDFDGDGDLDLVHANFDDDVSLYRNDHDTGNRLVIALRGTRSNRAGIGASVRIETREGVQTRDVALARGYLSSSESIAHFGLGDAAQIERLAVVWPDGREQRFAGLAVNRRYVITEAEHLPARRATDETPAQWVEVGAAIGLNIKQPSDAVDELAGQPLLPFRQHTIGPGVAVGDVNGDGSDDVVIGGVEGVPAKVMIARPDGSFAEQSQTELGGADASADAAPLVFDADGDGLNDLLLTKGGGAHAAGAANYRPHLHLNRGGGRFAAAAEAFPMDLATSAGPAVAADFDRDGRLDLFIGGRVEPGAYPLAARSALLVNRGGTFADVTAQFAPGLERVGMVSAALWTDVDDDGWLDLLLALQWGGVRCWRNLSGERFEEITDELGFAAAGTGWWTSLVAADFNGDGRMDYAAGNVGLNTRYRASNEEPVVLLRGAVDATREPSLLEAEMSNGVLVPVRGRSTMERVMPWIGQKWPTFKRYAGASLGQIFGEEPISRAQRFVATELRSGVFLSQPAGGYRFQPLPRIAQIAPAQGVVAGDFDGNGKADLYVVQNSYAPIPEIGRFAGGLSQFLRGDGRGNFVAAPLVETHLVVSGDAKGLATLDFDGDGWAEFVATRAGGETLAFGNTGVEGRASVAIALRGRTGNPTAIGARVTVVLSDGSQQTNEVQAGSGYLSQSSAKLFFGFPQTNPLKRIHVRWPSGRTTTVAPPNRAGTLVIAEPAS